MNNLHGLVVVRVLIAIAWFGWIAHVRACVASCAEDEINQNELIGKLNNAIIDKINAALVIAPDSSELYVARGRAWQLRRDYAKALADYDSAIRLGAKLQVFAYRGTVRAEKGDHDGAIADFSEAIDAGETDWNNYARRGMSYLHRQMPEKAHVDVTEALRRNPKWATGYFMRGSIYFQSGKEREALLDFDEFIRLDSADWRGYWLSAEIRSSSSDSNLRDARLAVSHATRACELTKWKNDVNLEVLARAFAESGQFDEAQVRLQQAIDLSLEEKTAKRSKMLEDFKGGIPHRRRPLNEKSPRGQ